MSKRTQVLTVLMAAMTATLIVSNICATKLWDLLGISADAGLIVFPLSYIVTDMLMEIYGKKVANFVAIVAMAMNLAAMVIFVIAVQLPVYPNWDGQEHFAAVLNFSVRISIASLTSFLLSSFTNNHVFAKMREKSDNYVARALASSLVGRVVDVGVFEVIAFLGVLSPHEFVTQAIGAYAEGEIVEMAMLTVLADRLVRRIELYIAGDDSEKR